MDTFINRYIYTFIDRYTTLIDRYNQRDMASYRYNSIEIWFPRDMIFWRDGFQEIKFTRYMISNIYMISKRYGYQEIRFPGYMISKRYGFLEL